MRTIWRGFCGICRHRFAVLAAALMAVASIISVACNVFADEPRHIRITLARSVSAIPLWGSGRSRKKPAFASNTSRPARMPTCSAISKAGCELGTLGYQSPALMAEQNVRNIKIVAGEQLGGRIPDHAQGR